MATALLVVGSTLTFWISKLSSWLCMGISVSVILSKLAPTLLRALYFSVKPPLLELVVVEIDVVVSSELLLRFGVSILRVAGGGIISESSGVEFKGRVWDGTSESALPDWPDCLPLLVAVKLAESLSALAELLVVWVPAYSVVMSVSVPEVPEVGGPMNRQLIDTDASTRMCQSIRYLWTRWK